MDSKTTSMNLKMRTFESFISSIFLYNSELWTMNQKMEHIYFVFHFMRRSLKLIWEDKITNDELYERTEQKIWSSIIKTRRLHWFGHLMRLPDTTPAKQSLREAERESKKPRGRPKLTWLKMIQKQLNELNIKYADIEILTSDRNNWRQIIEGAMSTETNQA